MPHLKFLTSNYKSCPRLIAASGGGDGVSFWCEEESCSTATVAAPFRVIIGYPILEKIYYNGVNFLLISPTPGARR